jgi:cytoskeletal protein CcmA (bactofilin family)
MWNKQPETKAPETRTSQDSSPSYSTPSASSAPVSSSRPSTPTARNMSVLGAGIEIKGQISGSEDLQIDGKVEGPIRLNGQKLTVGTTGKLHSEISAREVVVHGSVTGNLQTTDRVEIRKDASVVGDVKAARISVEDGAHFKGKIEIERGHKSGSSGASSGSSAASEQHHDAPSLVGSAN